jgi:hypothetical protein
MRRRNFLASVVGLPYLARGWCLSWYDPAADFPELRRKRKQSRKEKP